MKHLSRDEMKKVMGGYEPMDNENGRCCLNSNPSDCTTCKTGMRCNSNATWSACS